VTVAGHPLLPPSGRIKDEPDVESGGLLLACSAGFFADVEPGLILIPFRG